VLPARLTDAALPPPSTAPDRPPAFVTAAATLPPPVLVAAPTIDPTKEGEFILYSGGTPDEQSTRLVIDVTLSDAEPPARDAAALKGYTLERLDFVDQMPGTAHLMALGVWTRRPNSS
jgi:hypothetical protein